MADVYPQWWTNYQTSQSVNPYLNRSQVDQMAIQSRERTDFGQLDLENRQFEEEKRQRNEILEMYRGAFGDAGTDGGFGVPSEFAQNVNLFQPGGQFGAGGRAEVHRAGQQAIAAGQIGLASTGMSSGTNVAGLQARVLADTGLANKRIEDERVSRLGGALTTAGTAGQTAQQLRAQREADLMRTLSTFA